MTRRPIPGEYFVYRIWDEDNTLLYIGCTGNLPQRLSTHRSSQPWGKSIARVLAEGPYTQGHAIRIETEAIDAEQPRHGLSKRQVGELGARRRTEMQRRDHELGRRCGNARCRVCAAISPLDPQPA